MRLPRWLGPSTAALTLALAALSVGLAAAPYDHGERLEISGSVSDAEGRPLPDVTVIFEATRIGFRLRDLKAVQRQTARATARTDAAGAFSLGWRFDDYFNSFALVAAVPLAGRRTEELPELARVDLDQRLGGTGPVVVNLTVPDTEPLEAARLFEASVAGDDQRRVYEEMGHPDRVTHGTWEGAPEGSWWYFAAGRVYRFRDGELAEVETFPPVKPALTDPPIEEAAAAPGEGRRP